MFHALLLRRPLFYTPSIFFIPLRSNSTCFSFFFFYFFSSGDDFKPFFWQITVFACRAAWVKLWLPPSTNLLFFFFWLFLLPRSFTLLPFFFEPFRKQLFFLIFPVIFFKAPSLSFHFLFNFFFSSSSFLCPFSPVRTPLSITGKSSIIPSFTLLF